MLKLFITSFIFTILSPFSPSDTVAVEDWSFVKEIKGVKLYSRAIEGFEYKEVKAVLDVKVDLDKAKSYLEDPDNIEKWMSGCTMSVTKKSEDRSKEYYAIFDAPWPISDRDDYGRIELEEHSETILHLSFKSIPDGAPEVSDMVRVPFSKGHIRIEKLDSGKSLLIYQMLVDRGGSLPGYLKEYLENTSPVNTIHSLKETLEKQ